MIDTQRQVAQVREDSQDLRARQRKERDVLRMSIYGRTSAAGSAATRTDEWAKRAEQLRLLLPQIEALPIDHAVVLIRKHAEARQIEAELALAKRAVRMRGFEDDPRHPGRDQSGAERDGIGL